VHVVSASVLHALKTWAATGTTWKVSDMGGFRGE
jgi:hypothetical protein